MAHLQISVEDDGSRKQRCDWKQRCDKKLKELKEKDFTHREDEDAAAFRLREFKEKYASDDIIMDSKVYEAIKEGDPDKFVDAWEAVCEKEKLSQDEISFQVSHGRDSLLHVAAKYGSDKIAELVAFHYPYLLTLKNIKGNIPLHDAAQSNKGGSKVIEVILSRYDALKNTSAKTEDSNNTSSDTTSRTKEDGNTSARTEKDGSTSAKTEESSNTSARTEKDGNTSAKTEDSSNTSTRTKEDSNTSAGTEEALTRWKNRVGNTALHEAVVCGNLDGVIELYQRDKAAAHELNSANKSPLYVAVYDYMRWNNIVKPNGRQEKNNNAKAIVDCLLQDSLWETMPNPKWEGGKSPLHAAIEATSDKEREQWLPGLQFYMKIITGALPQCQIFGFARPSTPSTELFEELVQKRTETIYLKDEQGRSPLHYAALRGYSDGARIMLKRYSKASLEFDEDGNLPIHLACKFGTIDVVKELLTKEYAYPGLFLNRSGQNILHAAAMGGKHDIVNYILTSKHINIDLNETDRDGNTPLHVASENMHPMVLLYLTRDTRIDLQCQNRKGLMALDIVLRQSHQPMKYREVLSLAILSSADAPSSKRGKKDLRPNYDTSQMKDLVNTLMLVAILIATVTFAAGFTVPGSIYSPDNDNPNLQQKGTAVLVKRRLFQIFMICNTIAMYSSTLVVSFILLWARRGSYDLALASRSFDIAVVMLAVALMTMSEAFMAAAYLVVQKVSWLANLIIALGIIAILLIGVAIILVIFPFGSHRPFLRKVSDILFRILFLFVGSSNEVIFEKKSQTPDSQHGQEHARVEL